MSLTVSFTVAQSILAPSSLVIADTSTGTDAAVVTRRVYLQTAMGTYLVPANISTDYNLWPEPSANLTLNVLNADYALSILVQWLDVGNTVLYSKEQIYCFTLYSEQFYYYLTQQQAAGNANIQDTNYFNNKIKLRTFIDSANNAVEFASDIYGSQECLDAAAYMVDNQNDFF